MSQLQVGDKIRAIYNGHSLFCHRVNKDGSQGALVSPYGFKFKVDRLPEKVRSYFCVPEEIVPIARFSLHDGEPGAPEDGILVEGGKNQEATQLWFILRENESRESIEGTV